MRRLLVAALLLCLSGPLVAQGPKWAIVPLQSAPNRVGLLPDVEGFATLEEAIAEVAEDQVISEIRLHPRYLRGEEMQGEILAFFEKHYPEELAQALASSGNLHNPALGPLAKPLREAILATSYTKRLGEHLAPTRHRIAGVSFEKLSMSTCTEPPSVSAIVWLLVEKAPEPGAEEGSPSAPPSEGDAEQDSGGR